ncbi:hypothetical protein ACAW74_27285 [Fibrella sp. WM1]|uniref:hypothetical protein n=1 Tax=Fibrella musci TaxID=3242485 RepID=UPI0035222103
MKHLFTLLILMQSITPKLKGQSIAYHRHRDAAYSVTNLTAWPLDSSAAQLLALNTPATNTRSANAFRSTTTPIMPAGRSSISRLTRSPKRAYQLEDAVEPDSIKEKYFFFGNIGGNIDFINRRLGIGSVYTDVQFRPAIRITDALDIRFPIRIYYNNGVGPQQVDTSRATPQNFITVDTVTLAQSNKIRYWNQRPLLTYKTENRNIGLNIPVNIAYTIPSDPRWRLLFGLNFDFAWVTNRRFDFSYIANPLDSTAFVVNSVRDVPAPPSVTLASGVVRSTPLFYGTTPQRPTVPFGRETTYSQIYTGVQIGAEYSSRKYEFILKYSYGGTTVYIERGSTSPGGANHIIQMGFLEKTVGIQFFGEVRIANVQTDERTLLKTVSMPPYMYLSLSKTVLLSKLKELFFP